MSFFRILGSIFHENKKLVILFFSVLLLEICAVFYIIYDYNISAIYSDLIQFTHQPKINNFTVVFISVLIEAAPFILIGTFVSAIIQVFISEEMIERMLPKNKFVGLIGASLMGFIFPVCECAIVPIMRRLLKKGVPLYISVTFMLAVPIVNPVVLASTYYAFSGEIKIVVLRGLLGMIGAITIGGIIDKIQGDKDIFKEAEVPKECCYQVDDKREDKKSFIRKIGEVIEFASMELYDVGRFLIAGAFLSTLMQTIVPKSALFSLGQGEIISIVILMLMTFVLSLCSEVDAFIGRTFIRQFTYGSIIGFLIYGPMIDIKNVIMLSGSFKTKFVVKLVSVITIICFVIALIMNYVPV